MIQIRVDTHGFLEARIRLDKMEAELRGAPDRIAREGSFIIIGKLIEEAPKRSGRLAEGLRAEVRGSRATFSSSASYTDFVIHGTAPHAIYAGMFTGAGLGREALDWAGAEHPVIGVYHPGTTPNPFQKRAMEKARPEIMDLARRVAREAMG